MPQVGSVSNGRLRDIRLRSRLGRAAASAESESSEFSHSVAVRCRTSPQIIGIVRGEVMAKEVFEKDKASRERGDHWPHRPRKNDH